MVSKRNIARMCQLVLSKDRRKWFRDRTINSEKQKFEHFDGFIVSLSTGQMTKVDHNKIMFAAHATSLGDLISIK